VPCGRTSMPGLQATDLLATLLACSGRRHNQLCRLSHECKLGDQTKDDADKEPREERSCGRSQTSFYNGRRPHSSLDDRTPDQAYFDFPPLPRGGLTPADAPLIDAELLFRQPEPALISVSDPQQFFCSSSGTGVLVRGLPPLRLLFEHRG